MNTIETFISEIQTFILQHPYIKEQNASYEITFSGEYQGDQTKMEITTVNGEYEQIQIIINLIA